MPLKQIPFFERYITTFSQRTLSDKVVPIEKKNEIQSFVENFFLHRMVYSLSSNDFAFMDILGIYLYLGAETVLFQYSLDV